MDLVTLAPRASAAERAAVDGVLGLATTRWEGGDRGVPADDRFARGGHAARDRRHLLLPVAPRDPGPGRLDQPARPRVRLPAPDGPAGRSLRRRGVLPDVLDDPAAAGRGPRLRGPRVPPRRRGGRLRRPRGAARAGRPAGAGRRGDLAADARASAGASADRRRSSRSPVSSRRRSRSRPVDAATVVEQLERSIAGRELVPPALPIEPDEERLANVRRSDPAGGHAGPPDPAPRAGVTDPRSLDDYLATGGYRGLRRALEIGPAAVIEEVTASRAPGPRRRRLPDRPQVGRRRGPAGCPHYTVCNADESEPGTFKDRVLMEEDPFAIVEAMTIEGFATGSQHGFLYLRAEYPLSAARMANALAIARARRLPGRRHPGLGLLVRHRDPPRRRRLRLRRGDRALQLDRGPARRAAQQAALPGRGGPVRQADRGQQHRDARRTSRPSWPTAGPRSPRSAPRAAPARSSSACRARSSGRASTRSTSGPRWASSSALAGGVAGGRALKAVLLGGAAGRLRGPGRARPAAHVRGHAGGGSDARIRAWCWSTTRRPTSPDALLRIAAFFRDESCGQCVPCRIGTVRQEELLARLAAGRPTGRVADELALLADLGRGMRDASICGLGQTASARDRVGAPARRTSTRLRPERGRERRDRADLLRAAGPAVAHPGAAAGRLTRPPSRSRSTGRTGPRPAGSTILDACRAEGIDVPTLCFLENLTPVNVCRVCVVEVTGSRVLVPACSRQVEAGMEVQTDSERVRHSRKLVLELLGSSVDLSLAARSSPR